MLSQLSFILLMCVTLSGAVKLNVAASGGNASSPFMYGIMFKVRDRKFLLERSTLFSV